MPSADLWNRFRESLCSCPGLGMSVDVSRMDMGRGFYERMAPSMADAYAAMDELEAGAIANPDEQRMVGHYWLRDSTLAPEEQIAQAIGENIERIKQFAHDVHQANIKPANARRFTDVILIGIGGSALGPQLVSDSLESSTDRMRLHFMDNTDPDGMLRLLDELKNRLPSTLVLVVSKSGSTPEPVNALAQTRKTFEDNGLDLPRQAVAITGQGSKLDQQAQNEGWLQRFPMWDWVGGRMSVMAAVGLVPAALQGINIDQLLDGAAKMDQLTRQHQTAKNPAAKLALAWYHATNGQAEKAMVVLPYKDRLILLSRYLQQLVMESLGKRLDFDGNVVHQGITVYGNKGSTDQHAYVQQLRDGANDFFATFIVVQRDTSQPGRHHEVDLAAARDSGSANAQATSDNAKASGGLSGTIHAKTTPGDYLHGFHLGTRKALYEAGRESITISLEKLDPRSLGALIALYERAVGLYANLINVNAYHQPGVEAGKKAAASILDLQSRLIDYLKAHPDQRHDPESLAQALDAPDQAETIYHLAEHLSANQRAVEKVRGNYRLRRS